MHDNEVDELALMDSGCSDCKNWTDLKEEKAASEDRSLASSFCGVEELVKP